MEVARRIRRLPLHQQALAAQAALKVFGPAAGADDAVAAKKLAERYRFDTAAYIQEKLGWQPWSGELGPGQVQVIEAYELAIRQQIERRDFENGLIEEKDLTVWKPNQLIQNWLRVEAGHTVGKTKIASGLTNHFFDCFPPAILYTYAPTWLQIHDLLWKEIKADRAGKGLPGRILDLELNRAADHFAKGRATNNAGGHGTERAQGQHGPFLMFVLDEAEGIADFVYDAINSMSSGGVVIVLMLANPRTRSSRFYKVRLRANVRSFRMSCIHHPNVLHGRELVPNAVRREYVEQMVEDHCRIVDEHSEDDHTFELRYPVRAADRVHPPGTIFLPDAEFLFRVLGVAPANLADNTFVPVGRYEAAKEREPVSQTPTLARMGVDVARYGKDAGSLFVRHDGRVYRAAQLRQQDTNEYARQIKAEALQLRAAGVRSLQIRIDAGGGFGGGVADRVKVDFELMQAFEHFEVLEVHFNGIPYDGEAYADLVTELYAEAAETLKGIALIDPPSELEQDLCERTYTWVNTRGVEVKRLLPKEKFKKDFGRSPDDGDGFVLAVAPDRLFASAERDWLPVSTTSYTP